MKEIPLRFHLNPQLEDGIRLEMSEYHKKLIRDALRANSAPIRGYWSPITPESKKMRGYVMGCLMKLLVYLDGNDYRDSKVCKYYFEHYKKEFTPDVMVIRGKAEVFGRSTAGSKQLRIFSEKVQDYLDENYGISRNSKAVSSVEYKRFMDEIFSVGPYEDWIDYCVKMGWLSTPNV